MRKRNRGEEKGSALIEAALILPVLLLLFMGIVEFGRMLMIQQVITNAAREGARVGATQLSNSVALTSARTVTEDYLVKCGVDLNKASVDPVFSQVNGTEAVQVSISYDYAVGLMGWFPGIGNNVGLNSRVIMRREAWGCPYG